MNVIKLQFISAPEHEEPQTMFVHLKYDFLNCIVEVFGENFPATFNLPKFYKALHENSICRFKSPTMPRRGTVAFLIASGRK